MSRRTVHFFSRCCTLHTVSTFQIFLCSYKSCQGSLYLYPLQLLRSIDFFYDYWQTGPGVDRVVRRLKVMMKIQKQIFVGKQCTFFSKTHIKKRPILRHFFNDFCQFPINFSCISFLYQLWIYDWQSNIYLFLTLPRNYRRKKF